MARSSTTAACALAGATDHTLSERSWEQKVLFWRTSLKGWCEDPEVDCQPMVRTQQWIRLRVPATGIRMHKFHAPDAQVPCTRSGLPANGTTVLSPIWPRPGSQVGQLRLQSLLPNWRGAPDLADEACKNAYGEGVGAKPCQEECHRRGRSV
jgi:hypothetical protein